MKLKSHDTPYFLESYNIIPVLKIFLILSIEFEKSSINSFYH